MRDHLLIFVSSIISEMHDERQAIKEVLKSMKFIRPWLFEFTPASTDPLEESYLNKVRECDLFILILGEDITGPVLKEWQTALTAGKPKLVFIKKCERSRETREFINSIDVKWAEFDTMNNLKEQVQNAVIEEINKGYRKSQSSNEASSNRGGDNINITIGNNAQNLALGKNITQVVSEKQEKQGQSKKTM